MQTYKLIPQFRDNCVIQAQEEMLTNYTIGDTIFLISNLPTKKFSIISKIEALEIGNESLIFIDQRNLEVFGEGDEVYILKYNPAEALEVHISVSDDHTLLTKGDWTTNIKPSLLNKLIDLGQEVSFLIPWEGGTPIIGTGLISSTLPNPPVYIGDRTRILLDKDSNEELSDLKRERIKIKENRVDILEKQKEQNIIEFIKMIKHQNFPYKGQKYLFKATNPKQLFTSVLNVFKGLKIIEDPIEKHYDDKEQDYLASVVYLHKESPNVLQLIDVQIMSNDTTGTMIIWVTGENEELITDTLKRYDSKISDLQEGLEQRVEVISAQCPECGGDLDIKKIDINGTIECNYCGKISKIPKALRY
ncbi:MAG: hypothetical protein KGD73_11705 [Candidatus Lokiarchaeota archaeon]|nr:hypothetical protein [Candidatus Lokiarchaeota archaeon]